MRGWRTLIFILIAVLVRGVPASAADNGASDRLRAAYIIKMLDYIEWPAGSFASPASPYVIGVAGADYVADELARVAHTRTVRGRAIEVRRIPPASASADLHVLYAGTDSPSVARYARQIAGKPVLFITDSERVEGSVVNFVATEDRLRFEISLAAAERAGLRMSSRLLSVAAKVYKSEAERAFVAWMKKAFIRALHHAPAAKPPLNAA